MTANEPTPRLGESVEVSDWETIARNLLAPALENQGHEVYEVSILLSRKVVDGESLKHSDLVELEHSLQQLLYVVEDVRSGFDLPERPE